MASEGGSAPLLVVAAAQPGEASKCSHSKCSTPLLIVAAAQPGEACECSLVSVARHCSSSPRRVADDGRVASLTWH
eukprot:scaffold7206_cov57-Phaeocystis_antarctica.AAC.5